MTESSLPVQSPIGQLDMNFMDLQKNAVGKGTEKEKKKKTTQLLALAKFLKSKNATNSIGALKQWGNVMLPNSFFCVTGN